MNIEEPYLRDLLLVGGGHAHVQVLRRFGMRPEPGIRLTLISRESESPYTGMLPGFVAGEYQRKQIVIDLLKLSRFANCRFIEGNVDGVSINEQTVHLTGNRPPLHFDVLSINTGGDCSLAIPGGEWLIPVKPIGRFLQHWHARVQNLVAARGAKIVIVGGGPGSVELALALRQRSRGTLSLTVLTRSSVLLPVHGERIRTELKAILAENQIEVLYNFEVVSAKRRVSRGAAQFELMSRKGALTFCDLALGATGVGAPTWLRASGFAVDKEGFLKVNRNLQSESAANVFGAGDVVSLTDQLRPKSGVYSVREGPYLAENLRRFCIGRSLKVFRAQKRALALLRTAPGKAVASRGLIQFSGSGLWRYKDWIDRRFMRRFQDFPPMLDPVREYRGTLSNVAPEAVMRCGGCGAKLGADLLLRVLHRLDIHAGDGVHVGIGEDAAVVQFGNSTLAMSCDGFRAMLDDPWRFGRVAAHHALNDLYAMNSEPNIALALVSVPLMSDNLMESDLFQLMSGALSVFNESGVELVGGHTAEGAELSVGFTVLGAAGFHLMEKGKLQPGQALILTKPLGVGAILAGGMDGRCGAVAVERTYAVMDQSNAAAMRIFAEFGVLACTDVTGFGLGGHLGEMLRASKVSATLDLRTIPSLTDALDAMANGIQSSLQANNEQFLADCVYECSTLDVRLRILADPQTSGGLLAGINQEFANECIEYLQDAGYASARIIGRVDDQPNLIGQITVRS